VCGIGILAKRPKKFILRIGNRAEGGIHIRRPYNDWDTLLFPGQVDFLRVFGPELTVDHWI
jgi:hypothetical protein